MRGMLFYAHSGVRYLVLFAGLVAIVYLLVALLRGKRFDKTAATITAIYTGLLDLQVLLGLLTLIVVPFYAQLLGHVFTMFAAVFAAHGFAMTNKRRDRESRGNVLPLLGVVVSGALIVLGIMAIGRPLLGMS